SKVTSRLWPPPTHARLSRAPPVADAARGRILRARRLFVPLVLSCAPRARLLCERRPRGARSFGQQVFDGRRRRDHVPTDPRTGLERAVLGLRRCVPEQVEELHLLLAVAAYRMVVRQVLDERANACSELVGELGRRRSDEGVDVVARRLCHAAEAYPRSVRDRLCSVLAMRRPTSVEVMLLSTILLWALNLSVTKYILTHGFQPLAYATVRYGFAGLIFVVLTLYVERTLRVERRHLPVLGLAIVLLWLNQLCFVFALDVTTASTIGLGLGAIPIFAPLFGLHVGDGPPAP